MTLFTNKMFEQSRSKEIFDAAQARINANNLPGSPTKMSFEGKAVSICGFSQLLAMNLSEETYNQLLPHFIVLLLTICPELRENHDLFITIQNQFFADLEDLVNARR